MSKPALGDRVKSVWQYGATGRVVFRNGVHGAESMPAFNLAPNYKEMVGVASAADEFIVLFDDTQPEGCGDLAGQLYYGYDDDDDIEIIY